MRKIRPEVFKLAAEKIKEYMGRRDGIGCCYAIGRVLTEMKLLDDRQTELYYTIEFEFFAKMFRNNRYHTEYWFGNPLTISRDGSVSVNRRNQAKRIAALTKAYRAAKRKKAGKK